MRIIAIFLLIAMTVVGGGWLEVSMWNECRATNSFFYCARVLGK